MIIHDEIILNWFKNIYKGDYHYNLSIQMWHCSYFNILLLSIFYVYIDA